MIQSFGRGSGLFPSQEHLINHNLTSLCNWSSGDYGPQVSIMTYCKCQGRCCKVLPNSDPLPRFPLVLIIQPQTQCVMEGDTLHSPSTDVGYAAYSHAGARSTQEEGDGGTSKPPVWHHSKKNMPWALKRSTWVV